MKYSPIKLLGGGEYEQNFNRNYAVPNLLTKIALIDQGDDAEVLQGTFMTTTPTDSDAILTIHGMYVLSNSDGIGPYQNRHHIARLAQPEEAYVVWREDGTERMHITEDIGLVAVRVLVRANCYAIGTSSDEPIPPLIPQQKRPE